MTGQTEKEFLTLASAASGNENYEYAVFYEKSLYPDEVSANGTWNKGTWTLENHVLTISGAGKMSDFNDYADAPWAPYADEVHTIIVEDGVTGIGARAFSHFGELQDVICGKSLYALGIDAFAYSTVQSLTLYRKISSIGQGVVYSCSSLSHVAVTDQTKSEFLTVAHRSNYNTQFDSATFTEAKPYDVYDIDGSGVVNIIDVTALLVKLESGAAASDLDGDGKSTIRDVTALLNRLAA